MRPAGSARGGEGSVEDVPAVYYKGEYLLGQGKIITVIQEMYGLSQAKVEELKSKMK